MTVPLLKTENTLQWGRDLSIAETEDGDRSLFKTACLDVFNGAAIFRSRKPFVAQRWAA